MLSLLESRIKALKTDGKSTFKQVKSALAFSKIKDKSVPATTCVYITLIADVPVKGTALSSGQLQERQLIFAVIVGLQSRNDPTGEKGNTQLQTLRDNVKGSLSGWVPTGYENGVVRGKGDLLAFADNGIWWMDRYSINIFEEVTHG